MITDDLSALGPELLLAFVTVAELRSFTQAARRLGLQQSTVSQHVKRLEALLGRRLIARDTHSVALTPDGEASIERAREVLDAYGRLRGVFGGAALRGRLRLGAPEDFVQSGLADVLASFTQRHPTVDLVLTVGLSGLLYERFDAGELDVILVKRRPGDPRGQLVWRERLVWIGRPGIRPSADAPLPLLLHPPPSITRLAALAALEGAGRSWRITCTSGSLSGIHAAARAGLGVAPHAARFVPPDLASLAVSRHLPELAEVDFVIIGPTAEDEVASAVIEAILHSARGTRQAGFAAGH